MATVKGKRKKRGPPKPDNPAQSRRFIEAARALGVDESGESLDKTLRTLLTPKGKKRGSK